VRWRRDERQDLLRQRRSEYVWRCGDPSMFSLLIGASLGAAFVDGPPVADAGDQGEATYRKGRIRRPQNCRGRKTQAGPNSSAVRFRLPVTIRSLARNWASRVGLLQQVKSVDCWKIWSWGSGPISAAGAKGSSCRFGYVTVTVIPPFLRKPLIGLVI
jgi:hypothetical protein